MMKEKGQAYQLTFGAVFVALTAIGANITTIFPFLVVGGVPITLQTFTAILAGLVLGSRLGAFSMLVYMMVGLVGVPVFAQFKGGFSVLLSPTFGFIVSFILIAYVAGKMIESRSSLKMYITAALSAMVINYVVGTNWMYGAYVTWFEAPEGFTYGIAWLWMIAPLPKDIALAVMAGVFAHRLFKMGIRPNVPARKLESQGIIGG